MKTAVAEVPDFFEFMSRIASEASARPANIRYGQFVINMLSELRPDVAEKIHATSLDPFYWDSAQWVDRRDEFWNFVIDLWEHDDYC